MSSSCVCRIVLFLTAKRLRIAELLGLKLHDQENMTNNIDQEINVIEQDAILYDGQFIETDDSRRLIATCCVTFIIGLCTLLWCITPTDPVLQYSLKR